ncbi:MAG: glycoside hydrolase family 5 protein, partial [Bacteroidales bacterium]|nr:glycoside hydrolase family 5 protein [Bacteroidales bacterium]
DPYQFTLMEGDASWGNEFWYWGSSNYVSGSSHNATWGEVDYILEQFGKMKTGFVDKGYPVIIGEYCAIKRTNVDNQEKHNSSRADYNEAVTRYAKEYGCAPFYWETGTDINRTTGAVKEDYAIEGIMKGASEGKYPF